MFEKLTALATHSYHGAPLWAFAALAALLLAEYALGKWHPKNKSTIAVVGATLKLLAYGGAWMLSKFPPTAIVGEFLKSLLGATLLVCIMCSASGCGTTGATTTYQIGTATAQTGSASIDTFEQFDHDYQLKIVADGKKAGKTHDAIDADLKAYRAARVGVNKAFKAYGAVLLSGRALIPLVMSGVKKQSDLNTWLSQLAAAWGDVQKAITLLGVNLNGGK